ncbi:hypothetical protein JCM3770_003312 [Rhodotorula araucariae]
MIANGQDYWWVFHKLEYAAPVFQSADGKVEIHIAEHVAEPAMYNFIKQHMRTDDECIVIHAVDSDLPPLAVASGAEYIVQKLQSGYNLYCMSALGEARMEAVWPFREAVNALGAVLIGNDYSRGLMGVRPKRLVTITSLVDFARRDWALLNEAEPDENALPSLPWCWRRPLPRPAYASPRRRCSQSTSRPSCWRRCARSRAS